MSANKKTSCLTIILAAGEGKRMQSDLPKVLHPVAGLPMLGHVMKAAQTAGSDHMAVVVGNQAEKVGAFVEELIPGTLVREQVERLGTAHAVLAASDAVTDQFEHVLILFGDVPLVTASTLQTARETLDDGADIVVLGFNADDPTGYGRLIVVDGQLTEIREHKDASHEERKITLCNSGIMAFRREGVIELLNAIGNDNAQGEYYLPDAVQIGRAQGLKVVAAAVPEEETLGVNDRVQLAEVENLWQQRQRAHLMREGVSMSAPQTVMLHHDTQLESGVVLEPNIVFGPGVVVRADATIRAFSHLEGAVVGESAIVGPYARLRPGTDLGSHAKVGNFVETKATTIADGAKINHLSYVGDAVVGAKANIGAGTITCNYDGFGKHQTTIGAGAFIGTNTSLVAPVTIGENANTAAGSVIYEDVPADDLAIERSKQANLSGKAKKLREKNAAKKKAKQSAE